MSDKRNTSNIVSINYPIVLAITCIFLSIFKQKFMDFEKEIDLSVGPVAVPVKMSAEIFSLIFIISAIVLIWWMFIGFANFLAFHCVCS